MFSVFNICNLSFVYMASMIPSRSSRERLIILLERLKRTPLRKSSVLSVIQ